MKKVFINGESGTTGLKIYTRLRERGDIELISLPDSVRKDPEHIKRALDAADIAFLCLPDSAAIEAVAMAENPDTVIIDTSTAHRTTPAWAYGFPELSAEHFEAVRTSKRIAVPGCHASGFVALVYPLVREGILPAETQLVAMSLTGYSGGGKAMIADYTASVRQAELDSPRVYALSQQHKHLREMTAVAGLVFPPHFTPVVSDYYAGMLVSIPLFKEQMRGAGTADVADIYRSKYNNGLVRFSESIDDSGFISGGALAGRDIMRVSVAGNDDRITLYAQFDNLGKGASGAAVECMNISLGIDPETSLVL